MDARQNRTIRAKSGEDFVVSACDYDRVMEHEWYVWHYLISKELNTSLHNFIIGPRPADIPEDYVIDHANRDRLNASRSNLRWVSIGFNNWNRAKRDNTTSRFMGVSYDKSRSKWIAVCAGKNLGRFSDERDAAKAAAQEAIRLWGPWASESDLLIGPELLTQMEIDKIKENLAIAPKKEARSLPKGVRKMTDTRYIARYDGKQLGSFETAKDAEAAYNKHVQGLRQEKWSKHLLTPVLKDQDGDAAIPLTGKYSKGHSAKCPDFLWHQLTFETTWWYDGIYAHGNFEGSKQQLHRLVFKLCNPDWDGKLQVDHIIPEKTLDNRECNLRIANNSLQAYNKCKRSGTTSEYIGVCQVKKTGKWRAYIAKEGKTHSLGQTFATQQDAVRALNAKATELYGENARIMKILDEVDELAETSNQLEQLKIN